MPTRESLTEKVTTFGTSSRRTFLKWSAAAGASAGLISIASQTQPDLAPVAHAEGFPGADKTVWNACIINCGSRCPLRVQVKDGQVVRLLPDNTGDDGLLTRNIKACVRGRNMRERLYSPDRIKYPMKRKEGTKRGDGQWEQIGWDEAATIFATKLKEVYEKHGPEAILRMYGSGTWNSHINYEVMWRLLNCTGGQLNYYGNYSFSQLHTANKYHYGPYGETPSNSFEDSVTNGRMLVLWGNNPRETRMSGGGALFTSLAAARKAGLKVVVIDPMYSDSAALLADEWLAPRPGSDAALVAAIVHELLARDLHDQEFLNRYCVGFDEATMPEGVPANQSYRAYIEGKGPDGFEKTPEWASRITGLPAQQIRDFAVELGTTKPVNITQGWGLQRTANGEATCRAIYTLAAVLGQVGIPGGGNGGRDGYFWYKSLNLPRLAEENPTTASISCFGWLDAIQFGSQMTATKDGIRGAEKLSTDLKFMVGMGSNIVQSQHADLQKVREIMRDESKLEFFCYIDNQFTRSAELADLVLPDCTSFERWDMVPSEYTGDMAYLIMCEPAIEPLYESMAGYDICALIAEKFGVKEKFTEGRTLEEWVHHLYELDRAEIPTLPDFETFREEGVHRYYDPNGLHVSLKAFRQDPDANPLETPSGKIEIFSKELWDISKTWTFREQRKGDVITAIPEFTETWEGPLEAAEGGTYPIQLIGHHYKGRTHSTYGNLPTSRAAHPQVLWLNTSDAQARGIQHGDLVEIYNDRGRVQVPVRVTPRIRPGVASLPQGAWFDLRNGVDKGGAVNMLTSLHPAPLAKGGAQHTTLVQIKKAED
ncbi:MAG: DMSO/selenate family reductase complex A subunit [Tessaracoccus sp.]